MPNNDKLKSGVAAARRGNHKEARRYLTDVLKHDPDNKTALIWLAFVLPSPEGSVRLLERALALDPNDQRAQAGLQWARQRLTGQDGGHVAEPVADTEGVAEPLRSQPEVRSAGIQPARRLLDPYSAVVLVLAGLVLVTVGLAIWKIDPVQALALWRPGTAHTVASSGPANPAVTFVSLAQNNSEALDRFEDYSETVPQNLASDTDTIIMQIPELVGVEAYAPGTPLQPAETTAQCEEALEEPVAELFGEEKALADVGDEEPLILSADPALLIGPDLSSEVQQPVENLLLAHQPAYPGEKWIEVNVSTQQITAWEGDVPVFTFIGSTGLPNTPTVIGEFNIYWKLQSTVMAGPGYYLPDVPYTMYFYQGYALHGAYWHDNFGQPMSHGCVNLDPGDAQRLFEWADPIIPAGQTQVVASADNPGTLVVVHR